MYFVRAVGCAPHVIKQETASTLIHTWYRSHVLRIPLSNSNVDTLNRLRSLIGAPGLHAETCRSLENSSNMHRTREGEQIITIHHAPSFASKWIVFTSAINVTDESHRIDRWTWQVSHFSKPVLLFLYSLPLSKVERGAATAARCCTLHEHSMYDHLIVAIRLIKTANSDSLHEGSQMWQRWLPAAGGERPQSSIGYGCCMWNWVALASLIFASASYNFGFELHYLHGFPNISVSVSCGIAIIAEAHAVDWYCVSWNLCACFAYFHAWYKLYEAPVSVVRARIIGINVIIIHV